MTEGIHHAARTVSEMARALRFYRDLLGLETIVDEELSGEAIERQTGLSGAKLRAVVLGSGSRPPFLELIEYLEPVGRGMRGDELPSDVGAHHVAFTVRDIGSEYELLTAAGVGFTSPPQEVEDGFFTGDRVAYCYDPDGLIVELWEVAPTRDPLGSV